MQEPKTDIIITWVDGNDPLWRAEKNRYKEQLFGKEAVMEDDGKRFRDWDNIQYIFRGIERFMPWINKVHLITCGHLPKWIDPSCERLHIVKHSDYIPADMLPTFNSNCIELYANRIEGLADQFILFNDDMFVVKPTVEEDFFVDGLPCDVACLNPQPIVRSEIVNIEVNNLKIINDHFHMDDLFKNRRKWFDLKKYGSLVIRTMIFSKYSSIIGIYQPHIPLAYQKKTWDTVWEAEHETLEKACTNRFRSTDDLNHWLFRSWQLMSGQFEPRRRDFGILVSAANVPQVKAYLDAHSPYKLVCINDDRHVTDFDETKQQVNALLQALLPEKSSFEL